MGAYGQTAHESCLDSSQSEWGSAAGGVPYTQALFFAPRLSSSLRLQHIYILRPSVPPPHVCEPARSTSRARTSRARTPALSIPQETARSPAAARSAKQPPGPEQTRPRSRPTTSFSRRGRTAIIWGSSGPSAGAAGTSVRRVPRSPSPPPPIRFPPPRNRARADGL